MMLYMHVFRGSFQYNVSQYHKSSNWLWKLLLLEADYQKINMPRKASASWLNQMLISAETFRFLMLWLKPRNINLMQQLCLSNLRVVSG